MPWAAFVFTVLLLIPASASAAGSADPANAALTRIAKVVATQLQTGYSRTVPGIRFTAVVCTSASRVAVRCNAVFRLPTRRMKGVMKVRVEVNTKTEAVRIRTTSVSCTDSKTGATVRC